MHNLKFILYIYIQFYLLFWPFVFLQKNGFEAMCIMMNRSIYASGLLFN